MSATQKSSEPRSDYLDFAARVWHLSIARLTGGMVPSTVWAAMTDWSCHRAASGIEQFDSLMEDARAPERRLVTIDEVGTVAAFLASERASNVTGTITHIDGGRHVRM